MLGYRVLDAVYFAVRDKHWNTIPGTISDYQYSPQPGGFLASWYSRHRGNGVDFGWRGIVQADEKRIEFRVEGEAFAEFETNRIGFCLLHPAELAGTAIDVTLASGETDSSIFPHLVSPAPILTEAVGLSYEAGPGARLAMSLAGGRLETEDHRNWTDPGWKTYTPPLKDPAPRRVRAGDRISQNINLAGITARGATLRSGDTEILELSVGQVDGVMPTLGIVLDNGGKREAETLARLRPGVLHVELAEDDYGWRKRLDAAAQQASLIESKLSVAMIGADPAWLTNCAQALLSVQQPIALVSVLQPPNGIATRRAGEIVRRQLRQVRPEIPIGGGSLLHFAELNRSETPDPEWDFVTFPVTAQVHHTDDVSVMSTILGQGPAVRTASSQAGGRPVIVAPVSLRARTGAFSPADPGDPHDPREGELFGAAWLCASVVAMHAAKTITFLNPLADGRGVASQEAGHGVDRVFVGLAALAGAPVLQVDCDRRSIAALAVRRPGVRPLLIVSNLSPHSVRVRLDGLTWQLQGYEVTVIGD